MSFGPNPSTQPDICSGEKEQNKLTTRSNMSGSELKRHNAMKQVDLTTDELVDAYKITMRKLKKEHKTDIQVYNMLCKMSKLVVENKITWSKALEYHFSKNFVKAKSYQVSQNFVFRKFFCKWLELFLSKRQKISPSKLHYDASVKPTGRTNSSN